jgi:hypothetical protein
VPVRLPFRLPPNQTLVTNAPRLAELPRTAASRAHAPLRRRLLVLVLTVLADQDIAHPAEVVKSPVHLVPPDMTGIGLREKGTWPPGHPVAILVVDRMIPLVEPGE